MKSKLEITWCYGCGIEISWGAYNKNGKHYCCKDCAEGQLCHCDEATELEIEVRITRYPIYLL